MKLTHLTAVLAGLVHIQQGRGRPVEADSTAATAAAAAALAERAPMLGISFGRKKPYQISQYDEYTKTEDDADKPLSIVGNAQKRFERSNVVGVVMEGSGGDKLWRGLMSNHYSQAGAGGPISKLLEFVEKHAGDADQIVVLQCLESGHDSAFASGLMKMEAGWQLNNVFKPLSKAVGKKKKKGARVLWRTALYEPASVRRPARLQTVDGRKQLVKPDVSDIAQVSMQLGTVAQTTMNGVALSRVLGNDMAEDQTLKLLKFMAQKGPSMGEISAKGFRPQENVLLYDGV